MFITLHACAFGNIFRSLSMLRPAVTYPEILKILGISAKKRFSQNFLLNEAAAQGIALAANVKDCHVLEVGPGPGPITRAIILEKCAELDVVEIDKRFLPILNEFASTTQIPFRIHIEDILKFNMKETFSNVQPVLWDEENVTPKARLVGNLPFNISIGLLLQWMRGISEKKGPFQYGRIPMYLTFQKEVAKNLTSLNSHSTSRLTIMAQSYCYVKNAMSLHRSLFTPTPKVDVTLVELIPRPTPAVNVPFEVLEQVVLAVFQSRGKHIINSLKYFFDNKEDIAYRMLEYADVSPSKPCTFLTLQDFSSLCDAYVKVMNEEELPLIIRKTKSPSLIVND